MAGDLAKANRAAAAGGAGIGAGTSSEASVAAGRKAKERYKLAQSKKRYKNNILKEQIPVPYNPPGGSRPLFFSGRI